MTKSDVPTSTPPDTQNTPEMDIFTLDLSEADVVFLYRS